MKEISTTCRNVRALVMNVDALKSLLGLDVEMKSRGFTVNDVSKLTGIKPYKVQSYANGVMLPTVRTYNRLARIFGWHILPEKAQSVHENAQPKQKLIPLNFSASCKKFEFTSGKMYVIKCKSGTKSEQADYVFKYEGRQGIHHVFREIHGNWTRTYTDTQLIGKRLYEVEEDA